MKITIFAILICIIFAGSSCVKKNSCQCTVNGQKYRISVNTNSYFKARKICEDYEDVAGSNTKCRIKLL